MRSIPTLFPRNALHLPFRRFFDHTKNGSLRSLQAIEAVKTGLTPWAAWSKDGPLSTRAKVLKIATLLWQAAARRHQPATSASGRSVEEAMGSSQHGPGRVEREPFFCKQLARIPLTLASQ